MMVSTGLDSSARQPVLSAASIYHQTMRDGADEHVDVWSKELPWLDPIKEEILNRMERIVHAVEQGRDAALARTGSSLWQYKLLLLLKKQGEPYQLNPSRLAELLGVSRAAVSGRLATLDDDGLIRRTHDRGDRRRIAVELTEVGHRVLDEMLQQEEARELQILSPLSLDEQNDLAELLRRVVLRLDGPTSAEAERIP